MLKENELLYDKYRDSIYKLIIVTAFVCANLFLVFFHEIWRDEAQAWLLARDCSIPELFAMMKSEGHPCLWHLILMPFAKLGFPVVTMNVISCILTSIGVAIIVFKAPFGYVFKVLVCVLCTYDIAVIARSYSIAVPVLALVCCYYPVRRTKPVQYSIILFLLTQIHLIFQGLAVALIAIELCDIFIEKRKTLKQNLPAVFGCLGLIVFILQLWGCESNLLNTMLSDGIKLPFKLAISIVDILKRLSTGFGLCITVPMVVLFVMLVIGMLFSAKSYVRELFIVVCTIGAQLVVNKYVFFASTQRAVCMVLCFVVFAWLIVVANRERALNGFKNVLVDLTAKALVAILCTGYLYALIGKIEDDIAHPYSEAQKLAAYINEVLEDSAIFVTADDAMVSSVIAYLTDNECYSLSQKEFYTYVDWRNEMNISVDNDYLNYLLEGELKEYRFVYFISSIENIPDDLIQNTGNIVYMSDYSACSDERLFLYRLR